MSPFCKKSNPWTKHSRAKLFEDRGYIVETHGQKSFNGVAILSKLPLEDVRRGLPGDDSDEQARWIEATVVGETEALRICGLYLPNGNPVELDDAGKPVGVENTPINWLGWTVFRHALKN